MKNRWILVAIILASALSLASSSQLFAEDKGASPDKKFGPFGQKADRNKDGVIDETEKQQAKEIWKERHDNDNNPPGAAGGPGTNWEKNDLKKRVDANGDGSVDQKERQQFREDWKENHPNAGPKHDRDNNPPGPKGGPGSNWENKPGPQGGPGAGQDRMGPRHDRDNNPPGPAGGRGTNWENKPGPQGGPGASPNRGGHKK